MIVKPRRKPGAADVSDLAKNEVVIWQHKYYLPLILGMGFLLPMAVAGFGWGDWAGGFFFAGAARLMFVHHVSQSFFHFFLFFFPSSPSFRHPPSQDSLSLHDRYQHTLLTIPRTPASVQHLKLTSFFSIIICFSLLSVSTHWPIGWENLPSTTSIVHEM
jgi:hypothetical protein